MALTDQDILAIKGVVLEAVDAKIKPVYDKLDKLNEKVDDNSAVARASADKADRADVEAKKAREEIENHPNECTAKKDVEALSKKFDNATGFANGAKAVGKIGLTIIVGLAGLAGTVIGGVLVAEIVKHL